MNLCKKAIILSIAVTVSVQTNAQRLKATVDKEFKVKSVELDYQGTAPGPMMFFDAKKHGFLKLSISDKVMGAVFDPSTWNIVSDKDIKKLTGMKKQGYVPLQFSYMEGKPVALMRKSDDKDVRRIYMLPFDNNFKPIGRRPIYIGRGTPCNVDDLRDKNKIITDPYSKHRGFLSQLNCSRGEALQFSYLALDAEGKTLFEKKFRVSEDFNNPDGELIVHSAEKAFFVVVHKGAKGRYHEGNGLYVITDDKEAPFFPLSINGYVVRDFTAFHGEDDNIHLRGILSSEGNLSISGVFSVVFDVSKEEYKNLNIQQLDGAALKEALQDKKRLKPKQIDDDAPAPEYMITGTYLDRNQNMYLFAQYINVETDRVMQVATGEEAIIRHTFMRDIMVLRFDPEGKLVFTEIVPSSNVYTNHRPNKGYSFFFHGEDLYVLHPSYDLGISTYDIEESSINQPQMLETLNNELAATIINKEGYGESRTIFDLKRKYAALDPSRIMYDRKKNRAYVLAQEKKKRTNAILLGIALPEVESHDEPVVDATESTPSAEKENTKVDLKSRSKQKPSRTKGGQDATTEKDQGEVKKEEETKSPKGRSRSRTPRSK